MEKQISHLKSHNIVCGYGRIGCLICRDFKSRPVPFLVVEQDPEICSALDEAGILYIHGDATQDDVLLRAGILQAKGLITTVTSDSSNVFITLTARGLHPDLFILARASADGADIKLIRAGANKVVSPYTIGATRIAQAILRPSVVDFIDIVTGNENIELQIEEIRVTPGSSLAGKTLVNSGIRKELCLIIVGIKRDQQMKFNPDPTIEIASDDILISLGESPEINKLELIASGAA